MQCNPQPLRRQVLLDQQNTLRLMQADPSHGHAQNVSQPERPAYHAREAHGGYSKAAELSPWDPAPTGTSRAVPATGKSGKKTKKTAAKPAIDIPPALTALLQTVKQVSLAVLPSRRIVFPAGIPLGLFDTCHFRAPDPSFSAIRFLAAVTQKRLP